MFGETAEGWLSKSGLLGLPTTRHRRYCVLSGNELRYYKQKTDTRPTGVIDLKHYSIAEKDSGKQHPYGFRIVSQCKYHRSFIFYADHEKGCQYWMDIINATLDPFVGKHHACDAPVLLPISAPEESYSVLDKWLNRLDLNDHQKSPPAPSAPSSSSSLSSVSGAYHSSTTTTSKTMTNTSTIASSFSSYTSPTLRAYRTSTESLDSIPSETTLSSSAGSRAQLSNAIFTPTTSKNHHSHHHQHQYHHQPPSTHYYPMNSPPAQYQSPISTTSTNKRHSNPMALLSNFKQQYSIRSSPGDSSNSNKYSSTWSTHNSATTTLASSNNNNKIASSRKDWESEELFDFEDEMLYSTHLIRDAGTRPPPPPLS